MKTPQNVKITRQHLSTSTMRELKRRRRKSILSLVLLLISSGLLVASVHFACQQALQITEEEPVIKEVPIISPTEISVVEVIKTEQEPVALLDEDLFCMAAVIYNEAGGDACSDEHREMVAYVVLNRVKDPRFPNSIREVLEAPKQYAGMENGVKFADRHNSPGEQKAVARAFRIAQRVLENQNNIPIPENVVFQAEFEQGIGVYKHIGNTYFCYATEVN